MKAKQAFNPYLPSWEYVPDAEPHIVDGRVYVYGSHDLFNGINFCLGDYVCWSAPVDDLGNWKYHGCIYKREQDPAAPRVRVTNGLAAPDMVVGPDGRYYLYYFMGGTKMISVAVCDEPAGKYEFYGYVKYQDGTPIGKRNEPFQFDPGCLMDEDGRLYLYTGFAFGGNPILLDGSKPTEHGPMWFEIDTKDMLTVISGDDLHYIGVLTGEEAKGTPYEEQPFGEASSMRKFNGKYYFIYSSLNSHNLCYAVSDKPTEGFTYGGILVSCGDIGLPGVPDVKHARMCTGNTHGSLIEIEGKYYIFYHRHSNRKQSSRQACAEQIRFEDGKFYQAEMTSCGLNGKPLAGKGHYPTYIACNVYGRNGTQFMSMVKYRKGLNPFLTQKGGDREEGPDQYVSNFCTDCTVGFKYFDLSNTTKIRIELQGYGECAVLVRREEKGDVICRIPVKTCKTAHKFSGKLPEGLGEKEALYFSMRASYVNLANTPGIYYALAYGLSALLYIRMNRQRRFRFRLPAMAGIWLFLCVFMMLTARVQMVWFVPCMMVDVFLIFLMICVTCSMPLLNRIYFTAQAFLVGEFAASLEWQLFYFGLTRMGVPLNIWTNLLFFLACHGIVFGIMYILERRFLESNQSLVITKRHLLPAFSITVIIFALSNISYVLKNTPFSSQLTAEIFTIHTLTDLGGLAILFSYRMVIQEAQRQKEIDSLQHVVTQQYENYRVSEESIDLINRKYHDLKHQIAYLKSDISDVEKQSVLAGMEEEIRQYEVQNRTGNHVVDTILAEKRNRGDKLGIRMTAAADGAAMSFLSVVDICSLLGNGLDNAIEAAAKLKEPEERLVSLNIGRHRGFLRISIENRFEGELVLLDGIPAETSKDDKNLHGYGVKSMKHIVEQHDGSMKIETDGGWFRLLILIPIPPDTARKPLET